ncbi:diacylglycerol kinase catalytic region [Thermanaeromonas toyohensis ToBE]|uniref:Diacylglycerol kinase catalytic region n=1 Tax=Thermanaeromonas toyohensis ToBE TaxID=698762 RepID=A0A1W1V8W8_9FIRM|nr:hypothetical protein [Thermanaeromonas toyohensis]SMB89713.1 diacylglycerol kinase catalytic region [Thermanaeromonas toyohensis ToBE]
MKVGLIVNFRAGRGPTHNLPLITTLLPQLLSGLRIIMPVTAVLVSEETVATAITREIGLPVVPLPVTSRGNRNETITAARLACQMGAEVLVVVGGDGTLADAALGILLAQKVLPVGGLAAKTRLLGVGIGTTNVGPLVAFKGEELLGATVVQLEQWLRALQPFNPPALVAEVADEILGVGFNDCTFGFTVPATVDGQRWDVDATALLAGRHERGSVGPIGGPNTEVWLRRSKHELLVGKGHKIGQIIIGTVDGRYIGKAVSGGVCLAALAGAPAALVLADKPLTRINIDASKLEAIEPVTSQCFSLFTGDKVTVKGLVNNTVICVDGNPLSQLSVEKKVTVIVDTALVTCLRPVNKH